jgi:cytosine/adenosine deaminase-related metal-dependent hydrolase
MRLNNLLQIPEGRQIDILIENEKILSISEHQFSKEDSSKGPAVSFTDAIAFPGLINSHDHLDFNLFPPLGNRIYSNYVEWGKDIHRQNKDVISSVLKVPKQLRIQWGIYKNLLNGITTVINHGPELEIEGDLITVLQSSRTLHSVANEKYWKFKLNMPFLSGNEPWVIHIGEGTDQASKDEINALLKWNLYNRKLIGIHAVAMNEKQASGFSALVWCPDSNIFLLGQTSQINNLKNQTKILFGTDSTVSSNWNLWEQLRLAKKRNMVTDTELFDMLATTAADVWNTIGSGKLATGYNADLVIGKRNMALSGMNAFFGLNPENILMIVHNGSIRLFDEEIYPQLFEQGVNLNDFYKIVINGACKYVFGNLPKLMSSVKDYYPGVQFPVTS